MTIITTGVPGSRGTRQDIRTLIKDTDLFNLYLLGLEAFQAKTQTDPESWFQISGIHGRPYTPYDGVGAAGNFGGYCTHSSILFPTWHRPYVALYEQTLHKLITAIANSYTDPAKKQRYVAKAATFRVPYWDWAADASLPDQVAKTTSVTVDSPTGTRTIPNPLYAYTFHPVPQDFADGLPDERTWEGYALTLRYPNTSNPNTARTAKSQPDRMNAQLSNNKLTLRDRTFNLLTQATQWTAFSNDGFQGNRTNPVFYDSLESIHGQIHGLVGNNGHMAVVDFAAFDPIFWLHHTNVDRLTAIWQAINPTAFVTPRPNNAGTFTTRPGTVENSQSPLTPFRKNANSFWTSDDSRDTRTFGYTYPELAQWETLSVEQKRVRLRTTVNQLYGKTAPASSLRTTGTGTAPVADKPAAPAPPPSAPPPVVAANQPAIAKPNPGILPARPPAPEPPKLVPNPQVAKPATGSLAAKPAAPIPKAEAAPASVPAQSLTAQTQQVAAVSATSVPASSAPSAPAGAVRPPQHYEEHLNSELDAYRARHIAYWTERRVEIEVFRYEAGFRQGFQDVAVGPSRLAERKRDFVAHDGDRLSWEYEHGYNEAFEAWRKVAIQAQYERELKENKESHANYWKARNVTIQIARYEDGFKHGWDDAAAGRPSHVEQRKQEHIRKHGNHDLVWEFVHGYGEGQQSYGDERRKAYNPPVAPPFPQPPAAAPAAPAKPAEPAKPAPAPQQPGYSGQNPDQASYAQQQKSAQNPLADLLHKAGAAVEAKAPQVGVPSAGSQAGNLLHRIGDAVGSGQNPNIQGFVREGQQVLATALAELPKVVPNKKIHGHDVRDYYEWIANIRVKKYAVDNTFFVHVFIGDFDPNPENWTTDKNLVGSHVVFTSKPGTGCAKCISDQERGTEVTGTIPLTGALGDKFGNVYDLTPEKITPYLQKELHWRITQLDGTVIDREQLPSLKVSVGHTLVDVPDAEDEFPVWNNVLLDLAVTRGRPAGANDEDEA